jgi:hypothetical protein
MQCAWCAVLFWNICLYAANVFNNGLRTTHNAPRTLHALYSASCYTVFMGLKAYLSFIGLGTFLAWFAWIVVLFNVNPEESGIAGLIMFYLTLTVSVVGTLTVIMTVMRVYMLKREVLGREIRIAFRHSIMFGAIAVFSLVLSSAGKFHAWHVIVLAAIALLIEYFFLQFHRGRG